jgi:hypothetical protein
MLASAISISCVFDVYFERAVGLPIYIALFANMQVTGALANDPQNFTPQSSTLPISTTKAFTSVLRTALNLQPNSLQNGFLQFPFHARGSLAQCCTTMGTGVRTTAKLDPPIFYPAYLSDEYICINFENGVRFAARFSTKWLPSVSFSRAWEPRAMLRNYGDWCSPTWGAS